MSLSLDMIFLNNKFKNQIRSTLTDKQLPIKFLITLFSKNKTKHSFSRPQKLKQQLLSKHSSLLEMKPFLKAGNVLIFTSKYKEYAKEVFTLNITHSASNSTSAILVESYQPKKVLTIAMINTVILLPRKNKPLNQLETT